MSFPFKITITGEKINKVFRMSQDKAELRLGNLSGCDARFSRDIFDYDIKLEFKRNENGLTAVMSDTVYISDICNSLTGNSRAKSNKVLTADIVHGDSFKVIDSSNNILFNILLTIDFDDKVSDINSYVNLLESSDIKIAKDESADLVIISEFGEGNELIISSTGSDIVLNVKHAPFGVFLNGTRVSQTVRLRDYDYISFSDVDIFYKENKLCFDSRYLRTSSLPENRICKEGIFEYPKFIRNTVVCEQLNTEPIIILDPPAEITKNQQNILTSLMPAIVMFALCILFRVVLNTSTSTFVLFSVCSMGMGVITSIINIVKGRIKYKKSVQERYDTYLKYTEDKRASIAKMRQEELQALNSRYISVHQDIENIMNFSTDLFDRDKNGEDFLNIYLGKGRRKALRIIDYKKKEAFESGDLLKEVPMNIYETFEYIYDAPITIPLREKGAIGIVGSFENSYALFCNFIIDICARHFYSDVKIVCLINSERLNNGQFEFLRFLPHIGYENSTIRLLVTDDESKTNVFDYLYKEFSRRVEAKDILPHFVVFCLDDYGIGMHPLRNFIENADQIGVTFIFFKEKLQKLPQYCRSIIEISNESEGCLYESNNSLIKTTFQYEVLDRNTVMDAAMKLSPVYSEEISLSGSLRKKLSMFELLNIYEVNDFDIQSNWNKSCISESMAAPIGINEKNEIVYLDIHEKHHGPHGLVAGTTGSGKSELLQSYILGMALTFSPMDVGFLIIDFKGGGMANLFTKLPHLMGTITNIDENEIERSLKSIRAELLKRQNLFAQAGVNHIDKYIEMYKDGALSVPLPHLIIVVDEFAELKAEQPEFMKELISTARIGRSLGVHLILATQKPAGQVNEQIWSNSRFKICLKVQNLSDSNEVLKSPLAAEIKEPGRAYLQVGNNEIFELFQSGYSGEDEKVSDVERSFSIFSLNFNGVANKIYQKKTEKIKSERTQLEALMDKIVRYCEKSGIQRLTPICLPALSDNIEYNSDLKDEIVIGRYDNPEAQYQGGMSVLCDENILIIGSAGMGKTNLLMNIIRGFAESTVYENKAIYILDFDSMILKNFENLKCVGGVVLASDETKIHNLFKMLSEEMAVRRIIFANAGVSSYSAYCESGKKDISKIIVLIDNYSMMKEVFPDYADALVNLLRDGISVGINFIITNGFINGIGYKILASISGRICFYCNENNAMITLLGKSKYHPEEIPGRCYMNKDKEVFETQIMQAFSGEKEIDRVRNMRKWIEDINNSYKYSSAKHIPMIPHILTTDYLPGANKDAICLGLIYESILPLDINIYEQNELIVISKPHFGKTNFVKYLISSCKNNNADCEVTIFDNPVKKYASLFDDVVPVVVPSDAVETIIKMGNECDMLFNSPQANRKEGINKLLIFNNSDILDAIAKDKNAVDIYKKMVTVYRELGIFIIITCIENAPISLGCNEIVKRFRDKKCFLAFENLDGIRLSEASALRIKKEKTMLEIGDAYYCKNGDFIKIKTPYVG